MNLGSFSSIQWIAYSYTSAANWLINMTTGSWLPSCFTLTKWFLFVYVYLIDLDSKCCTTGNPESYNILYHSPMIKVKGGNRSGPYKNKTLKFPSFT